MPLSRGRAIPVDLGDNAGGGQVIDSRQYITITTPDAGSFRRSSKQVAADLARAGQAAIRQNG